MPGRQVRRPLDQARQEQVMRGLLGTPDHRHLLIQPEQLIGAHHGSAGVNGGHQAAPAAWPRASSAIVIAGTSFRRRTLASPSQSSASTSVKGLKRINRARSGPPGQGQAGRSFFGSLLTTAS